MRFLLIAVVSAVACLVRSANAYDYDQEQAWLDDYEARQMNCAHTYSGHTAQSMARVIRCSDTGMWLRFKALGSPDADAVVMMFARRADVADRLEDHQLTRAQARAELALLGQQVKQRVLEQLRSSSASQPQGQGQEQAQAREHASFQAQRDWQQRSAQCAWGAYMMGAGNGPMSYMGNAELARCRALGLNVPDVPQASPAPPVVVQQQSPWIAPPPKPAPSYYCTPSTSGAICTPY